MKFLHTTVVRLLAARVGDAMSAARWRLGLSALVAFGVFSLGVMIWSMLGLQGHFELTTDSTR